MNEGLFERFRSAVSAVPFFDCNAWLDPGDPERFRPAPDYGATVAALREKGVKRILMTNAECLKYEPKTGNERLERLIAGAEGVYGCMVLAPDPFATRPEWENYIAKRRENGFAAARMHPKLLYHSLADYACGGLYSALCDTGTPLILPHSETTWDAVHSLCSRWPGLNVIAEGSGDTKLLYHNRDYLALLAQHPNLYLEMRFAVVFDEIETICAKIGAEKLLFGTRYPYHNPGIPESAVVFADISDEEKNLIAHGNLERLCGMA